MPVLLKEDIKIESLRLFKDYQNTRRPEIRNQIAQINFGLVRKEAFHWLNNCNESYEDLIQVGSLGLLRAVERFEIGKGSAFSSFAIPYIRGEIQHYLRDKSSTVKIPRRWQELKQQSLEVVNHFRSNYNRQPTDSETAHILEISLKEWQEVKLAYQNREPLSLDVSINDGEDGKTSLAELVPDPKYRSFQLAQDDRIRLQSALFQLEDRTRNVLEFVFLHDMTQKETAEMMGISVVTVSRQVKKGLSMLKTSLKHE
jgi:RNA polymerase sigma-B factor